MLLHLCRGCRDAATSLLPRGILSGTMMECGSEMSDQASAALPGPSAPPTPSDPANNNLEPDVGDPKVEIDEELLTEEVKKFPILYNRAYLDYIESIEKMNAWNKVCQSLFEQWIEFSPRKKKLTNKMVQNKWQKQRDTFYKTYNAVFSNDFTPPNAKKNKINMKSLMFLLPQSNARDMEVGDANTNTDGKQNSTAGGMPVTGVNLQPELGMPLQPQLQIPLQPGLERPLQPEPEIPHNPGIPPVPSTSSHQVYGYAATYPVQPVYMPMSEAQTSTSNSHFAFMLIPLLNRLSQNALYSAWPEILKTIKNYEFPKRIQIIEQQLIYDDTHKTQENVEFSGVATAHVPPEEPVQEEEEEAVQDHPTYPSSYGRPTNPEGEIMYPETDHEDLDED